MNGCSFWCWERRAALTQRCDVMAEEELVGGAALPNAAVGCRLVDGVVASGGGAEICSNDKGGCWSKFWRETNEVVESCCVRPRSSAKL